MPDEPVPTVSRELKQLARQLSSWAQVYAGPKPTPEQTEQLRRIIAQIDEQVVEIIGESSFADFFQSVGGAMVQAQRALDAESLRYIADSASQPEITPSAYLIPKVTADLKFAARQTASKKLNVLIFTKAEEVEKLHQQSVHFEIQAVPPPPATEAPSAPRLARAAGAGSPPSIPTLALATAAETRARLLAFVREAARQTSDPTAAEWLVEKWSRALLFSLAGIGEEDSYAIMIAVREKVANAMQLRTEVWYADPPRQKLLLEYEARGRTGDLPFSRQLEKLGIAQEKAAAAGP